MRLRPGTAEAAAAAIALAATLAVFWPGAPLYDSLEQYKQAVTGNFADWHPPIMAWLWGVLARVWPGTAPMLVLQLALYWLGIGLLAAALARGGRKGAGWAALLLALGPILSCWMGTILKDAQMTGAATAAVGIAAWHPLAGRPRPLWAAAAALLLLAYATLVRANAAFATVPLGLALLGWGGLRRGGSRAAACIAVILAVLVLAPLVNQRLLGARREGPENSLLLYDIAGTSIRSGTDSARLPAARWRALSEASCYSSFEWDAFSEPGRCKIVPGLAAEPATPPLYGPWLRTVAAHPLAYAAHRLAHFNMTMRFIVPGDEPHAVAPVDPEPNRLGLGGAPSEVERTFQEIGNGWAALPVAWPAFWLALALAGLWASRSAAVGAQRDVAQALLLSAALAGLSYAMVSVASDIRYHLWTILASGVGLTLLWTAGGIRRPQLAVLVGAGLLAAVPGVLARLLLPPFA
jgi:hypothetical protein